MMKNKKVKYIFNLVIMFVVIFLVLYFSLKDSFDSVIANISKMSLIYLFIAIIVALPSAFVIICPSSNVLIKLLSLVTSL